MDTKTKPIFVDPLMPWWRRLISKNDGTSWHDAYWSLEDAINRSTGKPLTIGNVPVRKPPKT